MVGRGEPLVQRRDVGCLLCGGDIEHAPDGVDQGVPVVGGDGHARALRAEPDELVDERGDALLEAMSAAHPERGQPA